MKRPLLVGAICYIIGILWGLYFLEFSIVLIFGALIYFIKFKFNKITFFLVISFILLGIFNTTYFNKNYKNRMINLKENTNWMEGQIISIAKEHEYVNSYKVKQKDGTKIIIYISKSKLLELKYGDIIKFKGEFNEPSDARNYKGFNYKNYLKSQGIYGSLEISEVEVIEKENINIFLKYSQKIRGKIISNLNYIFKNSKEAGIALGMIIGDDDFLEEEIEENFKKSSLTHILCVSGANVAYITTMCLFLFKKIKKSKRVAYYFCFIFIIFFMLLTGLSASVVRAGIMGIIMIFSKIFYRKLDVYNSLALATFIILLKNPFSILDIGFQLSFLATLRNCSNISRAY